MSRTSIQTYYKTALDLHQSGKLREARKLYQEILKASPEHLESIFMMGQSYYQEKKYDDALLFFNKGLAKKIENVDFLLQKGKTLIKLNRFDEAKLLFDQLVKSNESNPLILFHAARNLKETGQLTTAIELYEKVLQLDSSHIQALNNLGNLYQDVYAYDKSMRCYDKLIELNDQVVMAYCNKAGLLQKMGKLEAAERFYHQALKLEPDNSLASYNLGVIHNRWHNYDQALQWIQKAIEFAPRNHKYLSTYATTLCSLGQKEQGIEVLEKLVADGTRSEEPYLKLARIFISDHENDRAVQLLEPYVKENPYCYEGMYLLGVLYELKQELEKAEKYLTKVDRHPEFALRANMTLQLLYSKLGRMDKYEEMMIKVSSLLHQFIQSDRQEDEFPVYNLAYYPFDPELVTAVTKKFSQTLIRAVSPLRERLNFKYPSSAEKIKIGYLSPYFKKHPAGVLIQGVLKHHDRDRFEVYGYAINGGTDEINKNIRSLVDHYVELGDLQSSEAAKRINNDGIHILVSLAGYNYGMKSEIPALRPAPIQVVCMDWHETMQVDFYDYVFKDYEVITDQNQNFFNESIAFLPASHFFNSELAPSDKKVLKTDYHLPEDKFVFACLNHPRKINPSIAKTWMKILKKVPNSILWLFDGSIEQFQVNISELAKSEGVELDRIIFCSREDHKDHLRRMQFIDLFLDTSIYNGHTTCLEALWMEIPMLTIRGDTVSARLCSSFLKALDLSDLICNSEDEYLNKTIELARSKTKIGELKKYLKSQKQTNDFFKPSALTQSMEKAYRKMWDTYEKGDEPSDFNSSVA
ncbi:O-linked N-acetylglucosamine transferase family protein [Ekhidna sp.]